MPLYTGRLEHGAGRNACMRKRKKYKKRNDFLRSIMSKFRRSNKKKFTLHENYCKDKLEESSLYAIPQKGFFVGKSFRIVDFYMPKPFRIAIEVDGEYHNKQKYKDYMNDCYLNERGIGVLRIKNENLKEFDFIKFRLNLNLFQKKDLFKKLKEFYNETNFAKFWFSEHFVKFGRFDFDENNKLIIKE